MPRYYLLGITVVALAASVAAQPRARTWPAVTSEMRPWTRWWWQGSAVDPASLTADLRELRRVGLGGVEITPIYGVRGAESRFIPFLSDRWVAMLRHTVRESRRLGLGVDMATGTGWPFGGPWVDDDMAPRTLASKSWTVEGGRRLTEPIRFQQPPFVRAIGARDPKIVEPLAANEDLQALAIEQVRFARDLPIAAVVAYSDSGGIVDVTSRVGADRALDWEAPPGRWTVYALFGGWHGKLVERAAPGGEGFVIDHFSRAAIQRYLAPFGRAFGTQLPVGVRAFFNDSYEVDDASGQGDWTPALLDEFQKRRGYDLRRHIPALLGRSSDDENARVIADYRETISDLLLDTFTREWDGWAGRHGALTRNQAHGSPANLLDLYAATDIPETEGTEIPRFKWATSAGHVAGRRLISAEAATWLGEHWRSTLNDVRSAVDLFFLSGVNHIVYHGTAFSPRGEAWPGWQFYAAVEFNSRNAWWEDFAALNRYVTRVQSFLQSGRPDNDVLLYFPFADAVSVRGKTMLAHFGGGGTTAAQGFDSVAAVLQSRGYTYDYVSDRQLRAARVVNGRITTPGGAYRALVIPPCRFMPIDTIEHVMALARQGAHVLLVGDGPADVSGLANLEANRKRLHEAKQTAAIHLRRGTNVEALLLEAGVPLEGIAVSGLQFVRRVDAAGHIYFLNNRTDDTVSGWIPVRLADMAATIFDPMSGRHGAARVRRDGRSTEVFLQIEPGDSLIVAEGATAGARPYEFYQPAGDRENIGPKWDVRFVSGGPTLPAARTIDTLTSWTMFGDDAKAFSGSAIYSTTFRRPAGPGPAWQLDLGRVSESARVRVNGRDLGTLIGPRFSVILRGQDLRDTNTLEVTVTNLSANRIADLDRRGVVWKKFYNVNYPARLAENRGADGLFSAAKWTPLESGLIGPVTLMAVRIANP
jgi:glycosyl hydrolase family 106( putative alpha-L-rhamnosidase)